MICPNFRTENLTEETVFAICGCAGSGGTPCCLSKPPPAGGGRRRPLLSRTIILPRCLRRHRCLTRTSRGWVGHPARPSAPQYPLPYPGGITPAPAEPSIIPRHPHVPSHTTPPQSADQLHLGIFSIPAPGDLPCAFVFLDCRASKRQTRAGDQGPNAARLDPEF